jgi:chromosome partitioning protein
VKVITFAAQKGGCGKSSLAISCAVLAAQNSKRVLLLDADPQATTLQWCAERNGSPPEVRAVAGHDLDKEVKRIAQDFDFILVDTPGQDNAVVSMAIRNSALTLIPCRPTMADMHAIPVTAAVARNLKRPFAFVLEQVPSRGTRADESAAALAEWGEVAGCRISYRMAWQDSFAAHMGVTEYEPNGPAARELAALWRWINARLKGFKHE